MWGKTITQIDGADADRIAAVCERQGVQVAVIGSPVGKCDMENPEECLRHQQHFVRMAELAHRFGTRLIRGFALWRPDRSRATDYVRPDLDLFLPRISAFLTPIVAHAEQQGVRFCLETEGATLVGTCTEARRVLDALGNPEALGLAWDVNNGYYCGEDPFPEGYALIRDRVYHVHVKPNQAGSLATVGETSTTYEAVLEALRDDGYDGWASIEHWGSPDAMLRGIRELGPVLERVNRGR
jgi:sugar phosphate isomerase/epimerase